MSTPVLTFFNNREGVDKTSLVYHLSWMLAEMGKRVLACDFDPQANLTSAFLDEDALADLWIEEGFEAPTTIYRCIQPDRKSTRLNSSHIQKSRMPSSA